MWSATQDLINATISSSRCPSARLRVCWDRSSAETTWFRLDESQLDSDAVLTLVPYEYGEDINEIITDIDNFQYSDETNYLISAEGLEEMHGDNYQSVMSESDIVLSNYDDRFTPDEDKNLLENPSWDTNYQHWTIASGMTQQIVNDETNIVSGVGAIRLNKTAGISNGLYYSDNYEAIGNQNYTFSVFGKSSGSGWALNIRAFSNGYEQVGFATKALSLASGTFSRQYITYQIPPTASAVRAEIGFAGSTSVQPAVFDAAMIERASSPTDFDDDFIADYLVPKRPTKISILMTDKPGGAGGEVPKFSGLIENIEPSLKKDTVNIHCYDYASELKDKNVATITTGMQMYQNLSTDALIRQLGYMSGLLDADMSLESGNHLINFCWFQEGSVWYYMQQLAEAEGGRVFFDEDGILNFWNRSHLDSDTTSRYTFTYDHDIVNLGYRIDKDEIKNHVIVKANPRVVQPNQPVWIMQGYKDMEAGASEDIWATVSDQLSRQLPCTGFDTPIASSALATSYWRAYSNYDRTGTDQKANVSLTSIAKFANTVKMTFKNNAASKVYLTDLVLYGTPATITKEINIEKSDIESISRYGRQILQIENDLIDDLTYASGLCSQRLDELRNPLRILKAEVVGVPYLQIGDTVTIQKKRTGETDNLKIYRNRWQLLNDGDFIQNLELHP